MLWWNVTGWFLKDKVTFISGCDVSFFINLMEIMVLGASTISWHKNLRSLILWKEKNLSSFFRELLRIHCCLQPLCTFKLFTRPVLSRKAEKSYSNKMWLVFFLHYFKRTVPLTSYLVHLDFIFSWSFAPAKVEPLEDCRKKGLSPPGKQFFVFV